MAGRLRSNSLIKDGYVQALRGCLQRVHGRRVSLEVIAVGATSTLFGLANLCRSGLHQRVDVLVFEYALNDAAFFATSQEHYEHWARAYEAVIRKSVAENPALLFVSVVLGQQNGAHRSRICPISAGILYLGERYGVATVDINNILALHRPELYNADLLYADVSHYSRPAGADLIGALLAERIVGVLSDRTRPQLPAPLYAGNYAHAKFLSLPKYPHLDPTMFGSCKNALFEERYLELKGDRQLKFDISGRVLLLCFVSHPASPVIEVQVAGSRYLQPTCRATFQKKNMKFLLSGISPEFHGNRTVSGQRAHCAIGLSGVRDHSRAEETHGNQATGVFAAPTNVAAIPSFWLVGILYCGQITKIAIE